MKRRHVRRAGIAGLIAVLGTTTALAQSRIAVPPIADPPTNLRLAGKFVWADLFTTHVDEAVAFYTALFPLEWQPVSNGPERYGLLLHDGFPVAGLALHDPPDVNSDYGRWVHFLSVDDVDETLGELSERGGRTVLASRDIPGRGRVAVAAGPDGELIGLIRSSSGDPEDYRSENGEWLWRELFSPDPAAASETYAAVCDCTIIDREESADTYLLASQEYLRAGITRLDTSGGDAPVWLGFVRVEDVAAAVRRAEQLGASVRLRPQNGVMNGNVAVIVDPVGAAIALVSWDFEAAP